MKRFFAVLDKLIGWISNMIVPLLILTPIFVFVFAFTAPFVIMMLPHLPPINQDVDNAICVELVDSEDFSYHVLHTLTDSEMDAFLKEFQRTVSRRSAFDPSQPNPDLTVVIYYADGCTDYIGDHGSKYLNPSGEPISGDDWHYFSDGKLEKLFDKYIP